MHIENMHEMIEDLTSCTKDAMKNNRSKVGDYPISMVTDMIKDLSEAEYYATIVKAMHEADEEQEEEEKYMLKRMKEDYGEEEGQRYYNDYRYANGRYAPKGRGTRRGYTMYPAEYYRDMDLMDRRMYTPNMNSTTGDTRSYSDGYNDGERKGYDSGMSDGYSKGYTEGSRSSSNNRYERARRNYEETKANKTGNQAEDSQKEMRSLEQMLNAFESELSEMLPKMSQNEKNLARNKVASWQNKVQ